MALELPPSFKKDIQSNNTNLIPVVAIYNDETFSSYSAETALLLSTNSLTIGVPLSIITAIPKATLPILLNVPSLKESIDLTRRNYKIPSVRLTINNFIYQGKRFSDRHSSLINSNCRVFWISPSTTEIAFYDSMTAEELDNFPNRAFQSFFGKIRRYEHNDSQATILIEDKSQETFHKELPTAYIPTGENAKPSDKNVKIPMVYGTVQNSPCVVKNAPSIDDFGQTSGNLIVMADNVPETKIMTQHDIKISLDDNILEIPRLTSGISENWDFAAGQTTYTYDDNQVNLIAGSYEGGVGEGHTGGPLSNNELIAYEERQFVEGLAEESQMKILPARSQSTHWSADPGVGNAYYCTLLAPSGDTIYGTLIRDHGSTQSGGWDGESRLVLIEEETLGQDTNIDALESNDALYQTEDNMAMVGCDVETNITTSYKSNWKVENEEGIEERIGSIGLVEWNIDLWVDKGFCYNFATDSHAASGQAAFVKIRVGSGEGQLTSGNKEVSVDELGGSNDPSQWSDEAVVNYNSSEGDPLLFHDAEKLLIYARSEKHPTQQVRGIGAGKLVLKTLKLRHWLLLENANKLNFFANTSGRTGHTASIYTIVDDILKNELGVDPAIIDLPASEVDHAYGTALFKYDFSINEKINSKKLFEELSSISPIIPRFDNLGNFIFTKIPKDNQVADHPPIKEADVIDFSFNRTDPEDIYTKIVFSYNYDYPRETFSSKMEVCIADLEEEQLLTDYDTSLYGTDYSDEIKDSELIEGYISPTTLIIDDDRGKYIRDEQTAKYYASWLLSWHCNSHLKMKIKLPLRYLGLEIGDVVEFDKILGDVFPYQIDYINGDTLNGEQAVFPKFFVFATNKTMDFVELEMVQLHQLFTMAGDEEGIVYGCVDVNACNYDIDATVNDNSCWYGGFCGCEHGEGVHTNNCGDCCGGANTDISPDCSEDCPEDCLGVQGGTATFDECGVCDGDGQPASDCDCEGNVLDKCNVCGGGGVTCGCNENGEYSLNYNADATDGCPNDNPDCCAYIGSSDDCVEGLDAEISTQDMIQQATPEDGKWIINSTNIPSPHGTSMLLYEERIGDIREQYNEYILDPTNKPYPTVVGHNPSCYSDVGMFKHFKAFGKTIENEGTSSAERIKYYNHLTAIEGQNYYVITTSNDLTHTGGINNPIEFALFKAIDDNKKPIEIKITMRLTNFNHGTGYQESDVLVVTPDSIDGLDAIGNINEDDTIAAYEAAECLADGDCEWQLNFTEAGEGDGVDGQILQNEDGYYVEYAPPLPMLLIKEPDISQYLKFHLTFDVWVQYNNDVEQTFEACAAYRFKYISCASPGDSNGDGTWNVLDIVVIANCILNQNCDDLDYACAIDVNGDGNYNVLDVVQLANCILSQNCDTEL